MALLCADELYDDLSVLPSVGVVTERYMVFAVDADVGEDDGLGL